MIGRSAGTRATAALVKGVSLGLLGAWVLGSAIHRVFVLGDPSPIVMGAVGTLALLANVVSALLLLRYRNGDASVRSVWLCSRNDVIMAGLFVSSAIGIIRQSLRELAGTNGQEAWGGNHD